MYARTPCILVVGSTGSLFRHLRQALREEGYDLLRAVSYSRGVAMAHSYRPDLIVLDMDISGSGTLSGLDFCTLVRQTLSTPMLAVSAVDDVRQKVRVLDEGADDYVTEPWSMDELLARVRTLLRRGYASRLPSLDETILYSYDRTVRMDIARQQVYVDEEPIYLTPKEFHLLYLLLLHAGKVLTHRFLLQQVWGEGYSQESGYLRVCICQLRKKIAHDFILTQASVGYLFYDGQERARYGNPGRQQAVKRPEEALHLAPAFQREAM